MNLSVLVKKIISICLFATILILINKKIDVVGAPTVTSVSPSSGTVLGGTSITINGAGFDSVGALWGYRPTGIQNNISYSTATDQFGNVYMGGSFEDTITFGSTSFNSSGGTDVWLAKFNTNGVFLWAKKGGGTGADLIKSLSVDSANNVYITGSFSSTATFGTLDLVSAGNTDTFLVKYNSSGAEQWVKRGGGTSTDSSNGVAIDTSGNVYITGSFSSTATFGTLNLVSAGNTDTFLVKYNPSGAEQVVFNPTGSGADVGYGIDTDSFGNVYITGSFSNTLTAGSTTLANSGSTNAFLIKTNSSLVTLWARGSSGGGGKSALGVAVDTQGNPYIIGNYSNSVTFGTFTLSNSGGADVFVVGYNAVGTVQWAKNAVGSGADLGNGIAVDQNNNLYVTGQYLSTSLQFDTVTLSNGVSNNPFLVKYGLRPQVTIGGNLCANIVYISSTQLTCVTPAGTVGVRDVVVTNPDDTVFTLTGGFTYTGVVSQLSFSLRNSLDTVNTNSCNLGVATTSSVSNCSYRLKVSTDASNGYSVSVQTSGGLLGDTGNTILDAGVGAGGGGGSDISASTVGIERYGVLVSPGSLTSGGTISRTSLFNAGSNNSVKFNYPTPQLLLQANNTNLPATNSDITNTSLVTHNLNISNESLAGDYAQSVIYTVFANY